MAYTSSLYAVAAGYNNAASLATLTPQPRLARPLAAAELNYYGTGAAQFNGQISTTLEWTAFDPAERNSILSQFGLSLTVASAEVTVRINWNRAAFANYNAVAVYSPSERPTQIGWQGFTIDLLGLEAAS